MAKLKFENSKFDNDKGVKEGSKADKASDAKQRQMFAKAQGKGAKGRGKK